MSITCHISDTYYSPAPMEPKPAQNGPVVRLLSQLLSPTCPSSNHLSARASRRSVYPMSSVPLGKHQETHTSSLAEV